MTQPERAGPFVPSTKGPSAFIIPNPWDPGTARLLADLGFEALATTSAGLAFSSADRDNAIGRETLAHLDLSRRQRSCR